MSYDPTFHAEARHDFFHFLVQAKLDNRSAHIYAAPAGIVPEWLAAEGKPSKYLKRAVARNPLPTADQLVKIFTDPEKTTGLPYEYNETNSDVAFWRFNGEAKKTPVVYFEYDRHSHEVTIVGIPEHVLVADELWKRHFPDTHFPVQLANDVVSMGGLSTVQRLINLNGGAEQCFYPFMDDLMPKYFAEFMGAKSSVLLLIGKPGTGKTTFLRSLILQLRLKTLLANTKRVIESPMLYEAVHAEGYNLLALEDADNFVVSREEENPFMAALLNDTQGVADGSNLKVVISTNLDNINRVDPALIRPGRCFGILSFRELTREEAMVVHESMKIEHPLPWMVSGSVDEHRQSFTLSEVLNPPISTGLGTAPKRVRVGFGS